jgi:hypothetical protein
VTSSFLGPHSCLAKTREQQRNQVFVTSSHLRQAQTDQTAKIRNGVLFPQRNIRATADTLHAQPLATTNCLTVYGAVWVLELYTTISTCSDKWIPKQTPDNRCLRCVAHSTTPRRIFIAKEGTRTPTQLMRGVPAYNSNTVLFLRCNSGIGAGQPAAHPQMQTHKFAHSNVTLTHEGSRKIVAPRRYLLCTRDFFLPSPRTFAHVEWEGARCRSLVFQKHVDIRCLVSTKLLLEIGWVTRFDRYGTWSAPAS